MDLTLASRWFKWVPTMSKHNENYLRKKLPLSSPMSKTTNNPVVWQPRSWWWWFSVLGLFQHYLTLVLLNKLRCHKPLLIVSQIDFLIYVVDTNSHTKWQTVQIQISWLLQKPTDLDLHCLQMQGISGFSRIRVMSYWDDKGLIMKGSVWWSAVQL